MDENEKKGVPSPFMKPVNQDFLEEIKKLTHKYKIKQIFVSYAVESSMGEKNQSEWTGFSNIVSEGMVRSLKLAIKTMENIIEDEKDSSEDEV